MLAYQSAGGLSLAFWCYALLPLHAGNAAIHTGEAHYSLVAWMRLLAALVIHVSQATFKQ